MSKSHNYVIQRIPLTTSAWTPVTLPFPCQGMSFRCDTDTILFRTDTNDSSTQDTLGLGQQEYVLAAAFPTNGYDDWLYVKAQTQDGAILIAKFVRFQGA